MVILRACIVVIAGGGVGGVKAPFVGTAAIVCTDIVVATIQRCTWKAPTIFTGIANRTQVPVVAVAGLGQEGTPGQRGTGIHSADVVVIAG